MPEKKRNAEEKLELLSQAVSKGWAKAHPVPEKLKGLVKETVSKQLQDEKKLTEEQRQQRVHEEQRKSSAEQAQQSEQQRRQERRR